MSLPYFPLYADDFEADTAHLTLEEDGAYNRLLRLCWRSPGCQIPDDEAWIFRKMRARTDEEKATVSIVLEEYFVRKSGKFFSQRLLKEWQKSDLAHRKRVSAGSKGGRAKALRTNKTAPSNAVAKPKQPEPEPEVKEDTNVSSKKKRGTRLPEDWVLPSDWGQWALSQQYPELSIRTEADRFRDYWIGVPGQKGVKLDWFATWRNWMRTANPPKVINGGQNESPRNADRLQRIVTAAAEGTSGQGWG